MNLATIKTRFNQFIHTFQQKDVKLVMQFTELAVFEYNSNTRRFYELLNLTPGLINPTRRLISTSSINSQDMSSFDANLGSRNNSTDEFSNMSNGSELDGDENSDVLLLSSYKPGSVSFKKHKCGICDYRGRMRSYIAKHLKVVHGIDELNVKNCVKLTPHEAAKSLEDYEKSYEPTNIDKTGNKKFKCSLCSFRCNNKGGMYTHIIFRHDIKKPTREDFTVLSAEEAARSIERYRRLYGKGRYKGKFNRVSKHQNTSSESR